MIGNRTLLILVGAIKEDKIQVSGFSRFRGLGGPVSAVIPHVIHIRSVTAGKERTDHPTGVENLQYFDWQGSPLPSTIRAEEVPQPGILVAAPDTETLAAGMMAKVLIHYFLKPNPEVTAYLSSADAFVIPVPMARFEVFVSFSVADLELAAEIARDMESAGLRVFQYNRDLQLGSLWREEVREALRDSRVVVVVLSATSTKSEWVHYEIGAAWGTKKVIIPCLRGAGREDIPELIADLSSVDMSEGGQGILEIRKRVQNALQEYLQSHTPDFHQMMPFSYEENDG